ncbi:MAG TPA: hypothetical protein VMN36_09710 [Verrucomicrobiales bacterium]|nr:hypothetical protein [Verrucomicrobiales bacterium]
MAIHLAISDVATQTWLNSKGTSPHPKSIGSFRATVKGWLIAGFPGLVWLWRDSARIAPVLFAVILLTPAICLLSHGIQTRYRGGAAGLWMIKGTLALLASTPALLLR